MVNFIRQTEIEELTQLLSDVGILPLFQIKKLLTRRGKTEEQIEIILNQMVKRKLAYYDETEQYLRANKAIKPTDVNPGFCKTFWLLIDLLNNIGDYFVIHNSPKKFTFINKNIDASKHDPIFDVYYIPFDSEKISCFQIVNEKKDIYRSNCFIVLDDASQIKKIELDNKFNVFNYVTISADGVVTYLDKDKED